VCLTDLLATGADLVRAELPAEAAEDSFSLLPLLRGEERTPPRAAVVHHSANGTFAIRRGKWKLILGSGSGGRGVPRSKPFDGGVQLYDMHADPGETTNLATDEEDLVSELTALLERYRTEGRSR
jgi:arylsulfatase A-like enzyme